MALSRPLSVAVAAMVLLVASVGFEIAFQRTLTVEARDGATWLTVGQSGDDPYAKPYAARAILVHPNDTLEMRLRVANGYPWSYSHHYTVTHNGLAIAEGDIKAGARDEGLSTFSVPVSVLLSGYAPKEVTGTNLTSSYVEVRIGNAYVSANLQLQEAA